MDVLLTLVFWGIILFVGFCIGFSAASEPNGQAGFWGFGAVPDRMNQGEHIVHKALHRILDKEREVLFNNVTLTLEDGSTTQIDHIFISTTGIFVIETKHYDGWIFADANSKQWMQTFNKTSKHPFQNPIHQNNKHVKAVESLFDFLPKEVFHSVIVFTGNAEFKTSKPSNVMYPDDLRLHLNQFTDDVISINRVHFCAGRLLFKRLPNNLETDKLHAQNVRKIRTNQ